MRMPRINVQDALYYVTSRGDNNENIFKDDNDYAIYIDLLKKAKEQFGFKLFAYALLPNHLHLLIQLKEGTSISQIMHYLHSNYTKQFNKKHEKQGHLFQERYKLILAEKEKYLKDIVTYIHLNPVLLGLTVDLKNYVFSSYPFYMGFGRKEIDISEEINEVLGSTFDYAGFVGEFQKVKSKAISEELNRETVIGSQDFINKIKSEIENSKSQGDKNTEAREEEARKMKKKITLSFAVISIVLVSAVLLLNTLSMRHGFKKELDQKSVEANKKIVEEKQRIYKDMDSRVRADKVSFEAMKKRLEIEKLKRQELEQKLSNPKKESGD